MKSDPIRPVTIQNLRLGILTFYKEHRHRRDIQRGKWDFHNSLYERLQRERHGGLDETFWHFLVDELARWKAIRGRRGITKALIYTAGLERLDRLRGHYQRLWHCCAEPNYELNPIGWPDISPLFEVAAEIKPVTSPVFASKLCHFLCPSIFPVFDNTQVKTGPVEYREYWTAYKKQWEESLEKGALIEELKREIPIMTCEHYPWSTKIFEICQYIPI